MPFIGAFTGTGSLRSPFYPNIMNVRASYDDETAVMINYLVNIRMITRISLLFQDDSFGQAGKSGLLRAMAPLNLKLQSIGNYTRNTLNVEAAVSEISIGEPKAIVMIGTYSPLAKFVQLVKDNSQLYPNGNDIVFLTVSFVGSNAFAKALSTVNYRKNVIVTQVVPPPTDTTQKLVLNYQRALYAIDKTAKPDFVSLEGYLAGKFTYNVLQRIVGNITRSNFIQSLYSNRYIRIDNVELGPFNWCDMKDVYDTAFGVNVSHVDSSCYKCNEGLASIWTTSIETDSNNTDSTYFSMVTAAPFQWSGTCIIDPATIPIPFIFGQSIDTRDERSVYFEKGIRASFNSYNQRVGTSRRNVKLLTMTHTDNTTLINSLMELVDKSIVFALIGFTVSPNDQQLQNTLERYIADHYDSQRRTSLAPFIGSLIGYNYMYSTFRHKVINVRLSHREEIGALVHYALNAMSLTRFSLVYDNSSPYGIQSYSHLNEILSWMDTEIESMAACDNTIIGSDELLLNTLLNLTMNAANPQMILYTGGNSTLIQRMIEFIHSKQLTFNRNNIVIACISTIEYNNIQVNLNNTIVTLIGSSVVPSSKDTTSDLISGYQSVLNGEDEDQVASFSTVEGYLIGQMITTELTLMQTDYQLTSSKLLSNLYDRKQLYLDDVKIGEFTYTSNTTGCNVGMRQVYISQWVDDTFEPLSVTTQDSTLVLPATSCELTSSHISKPSIFAYIRSKGSTTSDYEKGMHKFFTLTNSERTLKMNLLSVEYDPTYHSSIIDLAQELLSKYKIFGIVGTNSEYNVTQLADFARENKLPLIGPMSGSSSLRSPYNRYVVNTVPSFVDQTVSLHRYYSSSNTKFILVYDVNDNYWIEASQYVLNFAKSDVSERIKFKLSVAYDTSNAEHALDTIVHAITAARAAPTTTTTSLFSTTGTTDTDHKIVLLIMAHTPVACNIISAVNSNAPDKIVYALYSELSLSNSFIDTISTQIDPNILLQERLHVMQSLPIPELGGIQYSYANNFIVAYTGVSSTSTTTATTINVPYSVHTLEGYMTAQFIGSVFDQMESDELAIETKESFLDKLYAISSYDIGGYKLGPIGAECTQQQSTSTTACNTQDIGCDCNQAARQCFVSLLHYNMTYETVSIMEYSGCGVQITLPPKKFIGYTYIIIAGVILVVLVLVCVTLGLLFNYYLKQRRLRFAPTKSGIMICVFTDVQSSTKLWQMEGGAMKQALAIHNKIMRDLLIQFRGYEIKTVGDSFMVVFKSPTDAIDWAMAVQAGLLRSKWPSDLNGLFDCRQVWDEETQCLLWNGLRVRMGLNFGYAEYVLDRTTRRPDYFGTTINTAARIEALAHGGQVLVSEAMYRKIRHLVSDTIFREDNPYLHQTNSDTASDTASSYYSETLYGELASTATTDGPEEKRRYKRARAARLEKYLAEDLGEHELKGLTGTTRIYQIKSLVIAKRVYPEIQSTPIGNTNTSEMELDADDDVLIAKIKKNKTKPILETARRRSLSALRALMSGAGEDSVGDGTENDYSQYMSPSSMGSPDVHADDKHNTHENIATPETLDQITQMQEEMNVVTVNDLPIE
jgi:adenylate cyclase